MGNARMFEPSIKIKFMLKLFVEIEGLKGLAGDG